MLRDILRCKFKRLGEDCDDMHRAHIRAVADFVTRQDVLEFLLDFDPEAFFNTVKLLFIGTPLKYIKG